jgi:DNA polymerase-4
MTRTILHIDLDAFFCSVEELLRPELKGKPFVVAGRANERGVVSSASYAARPRGVRSAMPTASALRLCPDLIVVPPRHAVYEEYSRKVMDLLREAAPVVEPISVDEAFLDVSDDPLGGGPRAKRLQAAIRQRFDLPSSWGVATNRLVAKIATEFGKPNGLVVVPPGEEEAFLAPLPVRMIWGIGPKTQVRLGEMGVHTAGDLARLSAGQLESALGPHGPDLATRARGIDDSPVSEANSPHSISSENTYSRDVGDGDELRRSLLRMSEELGERARADGWAGWTVRVKIRWPNFQTITRQTRLAQSTDQDAEIYRAARELFEAEWQVGKPVRLLGVALADLGPPTRQLELFDRSWEEDHQLLRAIDEIRKRFGSDAVRRGSELEPPAEDRPGSGTQPARAKDSDGQSG